MDYKSYREKYFTQPPPSERFDFVGLLGVTLFFHEYDRAVDFYQQVLGQPGYTEGDSTKGWKIGDTWLTLLRGKQGAPGNVEVQIVMKSPEEAEKLQAAFLAAGATGPAPSDQLMYEPIRSCPVTDPFGTQLMIYCRL